MEKLVTTLFEYSFLCFVFLAAGFLFGYVLKERHAAKRRQRELEEANKVLELYASIGKSTTEFCHEISNYIGTISGNIASLETKMEVTSPEAKEVLETVKRISQYLIDIAKGFKSVVRGHFDDTKRWLMLQDVIEPIIRSQTGGAFRKLHVKTECRCKYHWFASPRIAEAFLNIIINACEAMEDAREKRLSVVAEQEDGCLIIRISDSGRGISPEDANRMFKYGFTTKPSGSGQGMSIAKGIIEENNGMISFESKVGVGTRFTIRFRPQLTEIPRITEGLGGKDVKNISR